MTKTQKEEQAKGRKRTNNSGPSEEEYHMEKNGTLFFTEKNHSHKFFVIVSSDSAR